VNINLTGGLFNSGTLAPRDNLAINAKYIATKESSFRKQAIF
jgi:hypothetical protein